MLLRKRLDDCNSEAGTRACTEYLRLPLAHASWSAAICGDLLWAGLLAATPLRRRGGFLAAALNTSCNCACTRSHVSDEGKKASAGLRQWTLSMSHEYLQSMTAMASKAGCTRDGGTPRSSSACALSMPMTPVWPTMNT